MTGSKNPFKVGDKVVTPFTGSFVLVVTGVHGHCTIVAEPDDPRSYAILPTNQVRHARGLYDAETNEPLGLATHGQVRDAEAGWPIRVGDREVYLGDA